MTTRFTDNACECAACNADGAPSGSMNESVLYACIALLGLAKPVKDALATGELSVTAARVFLPLKHAEQIELLHATRTGEQRTMNVELTAIPAELQDNGIMITLPFSKECVTRLVPCERASDLKAYAAALAADYGKPCAVSVRWTNNAKRRPRGFNDEARRIAAIFYSNEAKP